MLALSNELKSTSSESLTCPLLLLAFSRFCLGLGLHHVSQYAQYLWPKLRVHVMFLIRFSFSLVRTASMTMVWLEQCTGVQARKTLVEGSVILRRHLVEGSRRPTFSELNLDFTRYSTGHSSFDPQWCRFVGRKKKGQTGIEPGAP